LTCSKAKLNDVEEGERILKILGSYARLRILSTLAAHLDEDLTLYRIVQLSKLKRESVRYNLPLLVGAGLVNARTYGTAHLYALNRNNPLAKQWIEFVLKARIL